MKPLKYNIETQLGDQAYHQVCNQVCGKVYDQAWDQAGYFGVKYWCQVYDQKGNI